MITRVMDVRDLDPAALALATKHLLRDELVAFPTETVYGLGARATSRVAIDRVFEAKGRPADNPLIVHVAGAADVERVSPTQDPRVELLAAAFWPGPLTLVLDARDEVRRAATRGMPTVAVRVPAHEAALALLRAAGPLAAPSANLSGRPSPTRAEHVVADLDGRIPLVLDAGPCAVGVESTVLDLVGPAAILRPGAVSAAQIEAVLGARVLAEDAARAERSPGTRHRHYAPRAEVVPIERHVPDADVEAMAGSLAAGGARVAYVGGRPVLAQSRLRRAVAEPAALGRLLYALLRDLDALGATHVLIDVPASGGIGDAIADRIRRAAAPR